MRSNRPLNDRQSRRSDYHYHSLNRNQSHSESNGHNNNGGNNEYRSSKRLNSASGNTIIKRLKTSTLSNETNDAKKRDTKTVKTSNSSSFLSDSTTIDSNDFKNLCLQTTLDGYLHEEIEALSPEMDIVEKAVVDFDKFSEVSTSLRKLIKNLIALKKNMKNFDGKTFHENINENKFKGLMHMMEMKNLNRFDKYRLKEARKRLSLAKDKVDQIHLQLQNIQYEIVHLQKEQNSCASFRSKDESLDYVDEEKFYQSESFPSELKQFFVVSDGKTLFKKDCCSHEQLHKLHLAQLDWELKQRILFGENLKIAEKSRFCLEDEILSKKKVLSLFDPTLQKIIDSTKPLSIELNVPLQAYGVSNKLTPFLPQPLYVLYIQLCACKNSFYMNFDVFVDGSPDEACEFEAKFKTNSNSKYLTKEIFDDDDDNNHLIEDEDEELDHRKKSKKSHRRHKNVILEQENSKLLALNDDVEKKNGIFNGLSKRYSQFLHKHPMSVVLTFCYQNFKLKCIFNYFPKLEIVGLDYNIKNVSLNSLESKFSVINYRSNIFSKLFSSFDTGCQSPSAAIDYLLRRYGIDSYDELLPITGYTYSWAQQMSGIEYLDPEERPVFMSNGVVRVKSSIAIASLEKTLQFLIHRFRSRIDLQIQLDKICSKKYLENENLESFSKLNHKKLSFIANGNSKPQSTIKFFEKINETQLIDEIDTLQKKSLINFFEEDETYSDATNDLFHSDNFIFKLILEKYNFNINMEKVSSKDFDNVQLNVFIIIPITYPVKWPFFILTISNSPNFNSFLIKSRIKSLEEYINVDLPQILYENYSQVEGTNFSNSLLLWQLNNLQLGFDGALTNSLI